MLVDCIVTYLVTLQFGIPKTILPLFNNYCRFIIMSVLLDNVEFASQNEEYVVAYIIV